MAQQFPPDLRTNLLQQLANSLSARSIGDLRALAKLWRWPIKGTAKSAIVAALVANLSDPNTMIPAFEALPAIEREALLWLSVLPGHQSVARSLAEVLALSTGQPIAEAQVAPIVADLYARGLLEGVSLGVVGVPPLYDEWLPKLAPAGLLFEKQAQPAPSMSAAALSLHVDNLLSLVQADHPPVTLAAQGARSPYTQEVLPGQGPVGAEILRNWGYTTLEEQHLARFLLTAMLTAGLLGVSRQQAPLRLQTESTAIAAWQALTPSQQRGVLRQLWMRQKSAPEHAVSSNLAWTEIDLALEFHKQQRSGFGLQRTWQYYGQESSLAKLSNRALLLVATSVDLLRGDTWYSFERLCRILHASSPNLVGMSSSGETLQFTAAKRVLDPVSMDPNTWLATYGSLVAAWLTGPARWLGMVEVSYRDGRLVSFQRPEATRVAQAVALPGDSLRFGANGEIVLRVTWQVAELRDLVRQIASLVTQDRSTMTYRLDPAAFRSALRRGASVAQLVDAFAGFGFPLPAELRRRVELWESRAGRIQIYDQLAAIDFGDDLAQREVESAVGMSQLHGYPVTPRCTVLLDPTGVPDIVEALQRRGYMPKVLP